MTRISPILVVSLSCIPFAAQADDAQLEPVIVTASRAPITATQSGSALSLIDGATLQLRQVPFLFDALSETPSVAVSRSGPTGSLSQIRMRGGEANHTLVLIDGAEANDPASYSEFNFAGLLSDSIERVEILRGPQSALWGSAAVTGVINVITRAPQTGVFGEARGEYGSFDTKSFSGLFNAGTETYGAVLDGAVFDSAGSNISRTGNESDGYHNVSLDGRGFAKLAPNLTLSLSLHHVQARTETDTTDYSGALSIPTDSGDYQKWRATYGRAEAKAEFFDGAIETIAGMSLTRTETKDYTSSYSNNYGFGSPWDVAFNDALKGGKTKYDLQTNLNWQGQLANAPLRQRFSLVGDTARETFSQLNLNYSAANQSVALDQSGVAAEYWLGWDERVFLSLGARHDWNTRFSDSSTWRATLSALIPGTTGRVHMSTGTGVKNPDFYELFGYAPTSFVGNPALKPETSFGYDAGVAWRFWQDRIATDITYFRADLENEIYTDYSVYPSTTRNASGHSLRQGVEVSASAKLGGGLSLDTSYTYTQSYAADDTVELRRPRHMASLSLDYRFDDERAFVSLGADFHGSQRDTAFLNVAPYSQPVTLASYTLLRLAGSYQLRPDLRLTARIENAGNTHYEEVYGYRASGFATYLGVVIGTN
jgi:vitamin B12 transporter